MRDLIFHRAGRRAWALIALTLALCVLAASPALARHRKVHVRHTTCHVVARRHGSSHSKQARRTRRCRTRRHAAPRKVVAVTAKVHHPTPPPTTTTTTTTTPPPPPPTSTNKILWGATIGPQLTGAQAPWDWNAVTAMQNTDAGGNALSVLQWYSRFNSPTDCNGNCNFATSVFDKIRTAGVIPFLSWSSTSSAGGSGYTDAQIAAGSQDAYITQFAQTAKAWGHPFFLRFDWEMNGSWFPWGVGSNGNTAASFVAMWRHVHSIFTSVGATNATWAWCPNVDATNQFASMASLYPGDAYVDWTCLDGYNGDVPWTSFQNVFQAGYNAITGTIAPSKPMIIGETGSTESGGSKAQWITNMLSSLPVSFPKIRGLLWYDQSAAGPGGHTDWPLESSSTSEAAFAAGIKSPTYTSNTFSTLGSGPIAPPA
jgi:Glycosyl hydrolase family 26